MDLFGRAARGARESTLRRGGSRESTLGRRGGREAALWVGGGVVSVLVAVALFTRFGIDGALSRDEAIYTYGAQQLAHGVPPYAGIFDPKGPMATWVGGLPAAVAHAVGRNDVYAIRVTYFLLSCLTVLAVYLLSARLWRSTLAGVVAAVVFASFRGFAADALSGPDAKTPGVLFAVLTMWLLCRRQWFWGAFAGSLAFLAWQPLAFYAVVAVCAAAFTELPGRRLGSLTRAVVGAAVPLVLTLAYFAVVGALGQFLDATVVFPLVGVTRGAQTLHQRLDRIAEVVHDGYLFSGPLLWAGLVLLVLLALAHLVRRRRHLLAAVRHPLVAIVLTTLAGQVAYAMTDFQGYPDLYPFLPYAALGFGGAAAVALHLARRKAARRTVVAATVVALALLTSLAWSRFGSDPLNDHGFQAQRAQACAVQRLLGRGGTLYALGDPTSLAMTHRRNPDRFIYLGSGVAQWKLKDLPGGFRGWEQQVRAADPKVIVIRSWPGDERRVMQDWLVRAGYRPARVGSWLVYLRPAGGGAAGTAADRLARRAAQRAVRRC